VARAKARPLVKVNHRGLPGSGSVDNLKVSGSYNSGPRGGQIKSSMSVDYLPPLEDGGSQARLPGGMSYSPAPKKAGRMALL
jgi:hypothetical protein